MQRLRQILQPCFVVGVLALEMLRPQKQAFAPKYFRHPAYM
jgi:hypothetical protein